MQLRKLVKVIFFGDRAKCQSVLGLARKRLVLLQQRIDRSNGMIKQGWQRPIHLTSGEIIRLGVSFYTDVIEIHAYPIEQQGPTLIKPLLQSCFCNCNFSTGFIIKIDEAEPLLTYYNVEACAKDQYLFYENVLAHDFTLYELGQMVLLMAYNTFGYACCPNASGATGCFPKVSSLPRDDDAWRTTYRIVGVCSDGLSRWDEEE